MYFKLLEKEKLLIHLNNVHVEAGENHFMFDIFITNQRIVFLKDVNKELDYINILGSRGVQNPQDLQVVSTINLKDISKIEFKNNMNFVYLEDNVLKIFCQKDLTKIIKI